MKRICRAGIYNDSKHLLNSTYRRAHTQSHTQKEKKPRSLYWTLQPMRETSWGSEFGWAPVGRRRSQPHVWDSWLVAAAVWSNRSSGAEIRVTDGTHQGSTNRLVHSLSSPTTVNQLVTTQVLQISQRQRQRQRQPSLLRDIYLLPHGEGPWRESSRCPSLNGLRPPR